MAIETPLSTVTAPSPRPNVRLMPEASIRLALFKAAFLPCIVMARSVRDLRYRLPLEQFRRDSLHPAFMSIQQLCQHDRSAFGESILRIVNRRQRRNEQAQQSSPSYPHIEMRAERGYFPFLPLF